MLDEMTQQNASKFVILLEYENLPSFFRLSFRASLIFSEMNALVYVVIDQGIYYAKNKVARNEKWKKQL